MFHTKILEKITTNFFIITIIIIIIIINFFSKIVPLFRKCGKLWYSHITWRMRFARWITKATDTQSEYQYFLLSTGNNGYDLPTLSVLFYFRKHT